MLLELPDIVVLEVGVVAPLMLTNVIQPLVTVITTIGLEHTQVLGDDLDTIAWEKAGIISGKPGSYSSLGSALAVIQNACQEKKVSLFILCKNYKAKKIPAL